MARPHRSTLSTINPSRRSLPAQLAFPPWEQLQPVPHANTYLPTSHWAPFNPVAPNPASFALPPRPTQNQAHIAASTAQAGATGGFHSPFTFNVPQDYDFAINNCNREIEKWINERAWLETMRGQPVPRALTRVANAGPHAHQLRYPSNPFLNICPPAPRPNGNLPLPDVDETQSIARMRPNETQADGLQLAGVRVKSQGRITRLEEINLTSTKAGSSVTAHTITDANATPTSAIHASASAFSTATPPLRTISGEDVVVLDGLMELRRSRSISATAAHDSASAVGSNRTSRTNSGIQELTIRTSGLRMPVDGDDCDAPTPGLMHSPTTAEGSLSQSSTASSLPSVLAPPLPESPSRKKTFDSSDSEVNATLTARDRIPLAVDLSNDNRIAFRTNLPLKFHNFPTDGYAVINRNDGEAIGWSAGPAPVVQSLASCIRRGNATPAATKENNKRVTFEPKESDDSGNESEDEDSEKPKGTSPKGKGKAAAKGSPKALLSPRRAMKAAKKAKLDQDED